MTAQALQCSAITWIVGNHTVVARWQVVERVRAGEISFRYVENVRRISRTQAAVQRDSRFADAVFTLVGCAVTIVVGVNKVTDARQRRVAEVCRCDDVSLDGHRMTRSALHRSARGKGLGNHTVIACWQLIEQVAA